MENLFEKMDPNELLELRSQSVEDKRFRKNRGDRVKIENEEEYYLMKSLYLN